jgi:G3E family GTPase
LVRGADAVAQARAIVVKLERRCQDKTWERFFHVVWGSKNFYQLRSRGYRQSSNTSRRLLQFSTARAITHPTPQKAELFCEIRMMRCSAIGIA